MIATVPGSTLEGAALVAAICSSLGVGLMIGLERERRRKLEATSSRTPGGVRTFALASLVGCIAMLAGGYLVLAAATFVVGAFVAFAYRLTSSEDPGITTEIALVSVVLLGGFAVIQPIAAVAVGVVITILLAARTLLHDFAVKTLRDYEVRDGLILACAALVVWPLLPDRSIGPFESLNLTTIWAIVVLIMSLAAVGHIAVRMVGARHGLPFVGLMSGFVSSTATIGSMGQYASERPDVLLPAIAGATLSTVATFVQLTIILLAIDVRLLQAMWPELLAGSIAAVVYAMFFLRQSSKSPGESPARPTRVFDPRVALTIAGVITVVLLLSGWLNSAFGAEGVTAISMVAGLADVHSAAAAVATLAESGKLSVEAAVIPVLGAFTANTVSKCVVSIVSGAKGFALRVVPGLVLVLGAVWVTALRNPL